MRNRCWRPLEPEPGNAGEGKGITGYSERLSSSPEREVKMDVYGLLEKVRDKKPLVHHLTNWVTIYDCANIVKVFGASPVMAHAPEEVADMSNLADALVLNIGTLTLDFIESMKIAIASANKKGIPVILDVCGAGATPFRNQKVSELLKSGKISVIKGNASEIASTAGVNVQTKGVDAVDVSHGLKEIAKNLAKKQSCTVVITGKDDIVSDGEKVFIVSNGSQMLSHVVGTGCMATSVIGTFSCVCEYYAEASAAALCCFGIASEFAAIKSCGPGSFKENLYDAVFHLNRKQIEERAKIKIEK